MAQIFLGEQEVTQAIKEYIASHIFNLKSSDIKVESIKLKRHSRTEDAKGVTVTLKTEK